jgi:hypothetical protein
MFDVISTGFTVSMPWRDLFFLRHDYYDVRASLRHARSYVSLTHI